MSQNQEIVKYHNDMNNLILKGFSSRDISIFYSICAKIKDKGINKYTIPFEQIRNKSGLQFKSNKEFNEYLANLREKLMHLAFNVQEDNIRYDFVIFPTFITDFGTEELTVSINQDFTYLLNSLLKNFTSFELDMLNALKSAYSKNLFRFLKQYSSTGEYRVRIEDFKRLMDIPNTYRQSDINIRVLNPSIEELKVHFKDLKVTKLKKGKSVTHLLFTFKPFKTIPASIESTLLCPHCGQGLIKKVNKTTNIAFYGHVNTALCNKTYSSLDEVINNQPEATSHPSELNLIQKLEKLKALNSDNLRILKIDSQKQEVTVEINEEVFCYGINDKTVDYLVSKIL